MRTIFGCALTLALATTASVTLAAEEGEAAPADAAAADSASAEAPATEAAEGAPEGEKAATAPDEDSALVADAEAGGSPIEQPGRTYLFVGARYRAIILPKFMMNIFGDGGDTVLIHGFGPEFGVRKDSFEYNFSIWYAGYGMDPTPFKASSDPATAWEIVESELKVVYLTADFLWSQDFTPEFALNYGLGGGIGFVFGDLRRVQAFPGTPGADTNTGEGFLPCPGPGADAQGYCGTDNDHYGDYTEPSWADGGSKPIIFPWFVLQTGIRYKPHRNFVARLDAGFGTSGFFLGLGADYGL